MSEHNHIALPQYSLPAIIGIWLAVTLPIGILGWVAAPFISAKINNAGVGRMLAITAGLIWQFIVVLILLHKETGSFRWGAVKHALRLGQPVTPGTGTENRRLWLLLIPIVLLTALYQIVVAKHIIALWTSAFPLFAEPPLFSLAAYLGSPEGRTEMAGAWGVFALYVVCAIFNTFLGEELLFRGILLPRMNGVFGKGDWVANGLLFGLYHVHQPWGIVSTSILAVFIFALCAKLFRCTWFAVIPHSGQSVFFIITMLAMLLGLG
jgi:membrane protease YdiL (CAAX protease family)